MATYSTQLTSKEKYKSLAYIVAAIAVVLLLIIYFYRQLSIPYHDYGYQPIAITIVVLNFLLPYLLMKLIFRIASLRVSEEELHIRDIWEQWGRDMHGYDNSETKHKHEQQAGNE